MKAKGTVEAPTPPLEREETDHYRLELSGLPKGKATSVVVTYDDRLDPVRYDLGISPDGTVGFTFPIYGSNGVARVFAADVDGEGNPVADTAKLVGDPVALT